MIKNGWLVNDSHGQDFMVKISCGRGILNSVLFPFLGLQVLIINEFSLI